MKEFSHDPVDASRSCSRIYEADSTWTWTWTAARHEGGGYIDLCAWSATRGAAPTCLNTNCIFPFSLLRSRLLFNAPATATTRISFPWTSIAYDHGCLRRVNPDIISFFFLFFSLFFALTACGSLGKSQTDRLIFQIFSIKKSPLLSFVLMKKLNISRLR